MATTINFFALQAAFATDDLLRKTSPDNIEDFIESYYRSSMDFRIKPSSQKYHVVFNGRQIYQYDDIDLILGTTRKLNSSKTELIDVLYFTGHSEKGKFQFSKDKNIESFKVIDKLVSKKCKSLIISSCDFLKEEKDLDKKLIAAFNKSKSLKLLITISSGGPGLNSEDDYLLVGTITNILFDNLKLFDIPSFGDVSSKIEKRLKGIFKDSFLSKAGIKILYKGKGKKNPEVINFR
jgi:hypothetical protein